MRSWRCWFAGPIRRRGRLSEDCGPYVTSLLSGAIRVFMTTREGANPRFLHRSWTELGSFYLSYESPDDGLRLGLEALEKLTLSIERSYLKDQLFAHTSHCLLYTSDAADE